MFNWQLVFNPIKENYEEIKLNIDVLWIDYAKKIVKDDDNAEWAIPTKDIYTLSYTGKYIEYKKINKLYREKVNTFIKKYKLKDDTIIKSSDTHKFLTDNNIWSNTLNSGDYMYKYERNEIKRVQIESIEIMKYNGFKYKKSDEPFAMLNGKLNSLIIGELIKKGEKLNYPTTKQIKIK